jgi:hypothetical protein
MQDRQTIGKSSLDLLVNADDLDHSAYEQMQQQLEDYENNFIECLEAGKKIYPHDFYIVVETKKEPKLKNVLRNYFIHRQSCPTPTYDNAVHKYHKADDRLEFLWVLPSKETYQMMLSHALEIPSEERDLLQFVLDDADGTLLKKCKKLNGEL